MQIIRTKISTRIVTGFTVLLLLVVSIAFGAYFGISSIKTATEASNRVGRIVRLITEARQNEKDYILTRDTEASSQVNEAIGRIQTELKDIREQFSNDVDNALLNRIEEAVANYGQAFTNLIDLEVQRSETSRKMIQSSLTAEVQVRIIHKDQEKQLQEIFKNTEEFVSRKLQNLRDTNQLQLLMAESRVLRISLMRSKISYTVKKWQNINKEVFDLLTALKNRFTAEDNLRLVDAILSDYQAYVDLFNAYLENPNLADRKQVIMLAKNMTDGLEAIYQDQGKQVSEAQEQRATAVTDKLGKLSKANRLIDLLIQARKYEKEFFTTGEKRFHEDAVAKLTEALAMCETLKSQFRNDKNLRNIDTAIAAITAYKGQLGEYADIVIRQAEAKTAMTAAAQAAEDACDNVGDLQTAEMNRQIDRSTLLLMIGSLAAVLVGLFFAGVITKGITTPLREAVRNLRENAEQVLAASGQVSSASQSLARGTSRQAASVEETSASLEEMASMTHQNSDHASRANSLMREAKETIANAETAMTNLVGSMSDMSQVSRETSKIIKTIDEIAFQTNLLALNAAVEAARAGEAGAGFAVVADEVRNLAIRAASAAKETARLIEGTIAKIDAGSGMVEQAGTAFSEVSDRTVKAGELVDEISAALTENAQGIAQINKAMTEMDRVIQQNAASAEESASASEEMKSQSVRMRRVVNRLSAMVTGSRSAEVPDRRPSEPAAAGGEKAPEAAPAAKRPKPSPAARKGNVEIGSDEILDMEEEEIFKNF